MAKISLCMIVKNEQELIADAIKSVKSIVDEIIVVDTGSTDKTKEIVKKLGAKVFDFKWNKNFSDARNFSIEKATNKWILILDADEVIGKKDLDELRAYTDKKMDGISFITRNYSDEQSGIGWTVINEEYPEAKGFSGYFQSEKIRLFRKDKRFYFKGKVHETVDESMKKAGAKIYKSYISIHHYQELKKGDNLIQKQLVYLELCKENVKKDKKDFKAFHDMAVIYLRFKNDLTNAKKALESCLKINEHFIPALLDLGTVYLHEKNYKKAIEYYEKALKINSSTLSAYNNLGMVYTATKEYDKAIKAYEAAITLNHPRKEQLMGEILVLKNLMEGGSPISIGYEFKFGE